MKPSRITFALLVLSITSSLCAKQTVAERNSDTTAVISKEEVQEVVDKWLELWATYDLELLNEIFYKSSEMTYFSSEKEGLIKGYQQMLPHHKGFGFVQGGKKPERSLWLEEVEILTYGTTAMIAAIWYFGDRGTDKESVQHGPVTFIVKRNTGGKVRIIHTHFANY